MTMRVFGPKAADHPSIGRPCRICGDGFREGDITVLIGDEPGSDDDREKRDAGRPYNAIAYEAHVSHFPMNAERGRREHV